MWWGVGRAEQKELPWYAQCTDDSSTLMTVQMEVTNPLYIRVLGQIDCHLAADRIVIILLCSTLALKSQKNKASNMWICAWEQQQQNHQEYNKQKSTNKTQTPRKPYPHPKSHRVMKEFQLNNQGVEGIKVLVPHYWNGYAIPTESIYFTAPLY